MTRAVLFDTETTGLTPEEGHRVIEVAALELFNDLPTGRVFHALIDPERDVPPDASRVHGLTRDHLIGKPLFAAVAADLLAFLGDGPLVAHNAAFDFCFMDAEFARIGAPCLDPSRMVDTLALAKARFPGLPNSLDALCRRYAIDLSARTTHNALLDCRLLSEVYVQLTGGRQRGLELAGADDGGRIIAYSYAGTRQPRRIVPDERTLAAHAVLVARLKDPVWLAA